MALCSRSGILGITARRLFLPTIPAAFGLPMLELSSGDKLSSADCSAVDQSSSRCADESQYVDDDFTSAAVSTPALVPRLSLRPLARHSTLAALALFSVIYALMVGELPSLPLAIVLFALVSVLRALLAALCIGESPAGVLYLRSLDR